MKKAKTYRLVKYYYAYSKKKGAHEKSVTIAKGIATIEEAKEMILKDHPKAVIVDNVARNVGGFLYPSRIVIK